MGKGIWMFIALISGALLPIQAGLNSKLGKATGSPIYAAAISFLTGTIALFLYIAITGQTINWQQLRNIPIAYWLGGLLGAFYVSATIYAFPKIGPALTFGLVVASQMIISVIMDHYNILVAQPHPVNIWRIFGIVMIIAGVIIIRKF